MIKKLTNSLLALLLAIVLFTACKKDEEPQFFEATEIASTCILNGSGDYIVQNQAVFDSMVVIRSTIFYPGGSPCDDAKHLEIDFNAFTLVGVARSGNCSEPSISHDIVLENNIVTFNFIRPEIDSLIPTCLSIVSYSRWYKISKTASSSIKFNVH